MPQRDEESSTSHRRIRPWLRRVWLLALFGTTGMLAVLVAVGLWLFANLDHPWVKSRMEPLLSDLIGTSVRYEHLSLSPFSGVELRALVVETPDPLRAHAPDLVRLEELTIPIDLGGLLSGEIRVPDVRGGPIAVTVVVTDDGRNSFSHLALEVPEQHEPGQMSTPLSSSLDVLRRLPFELGPIRLAPIQLRVVEVTGTQRRQTDLKSLAVSSSGLSLGRAPHGVVYLHAHDGDDVVLSVLESNESASAIPPREARMAPLLELRLEDRRSLALHANVALGDQSLFPELRPVGSLVQLDARATFDPDQELTTLDLQRLSLLDSMLSAHARAALSDASTPRQEQQQCAPALAPLPFAEAYIEGQAELDARSLPWVLPWLSLNDLTARFELRGLQIEPAGVSGGSVGFEARLGDARYADGPRSVDVDRAAIHGALLAPENPAHLLGRLTLQASIDEVTAVERDYATVAVRKLRVTSDLQDLTQQSSGLARMGGTGSLAGSIEQVSAKLGALSAESKVSVALNADLTHDRVTGTVPIESLVLNGLTHDPVALRSARVDIAVLEAMAWAESAGTPVLLADTSIERISIGKRNLRVPKGFLETKRTAVGRYAVEARLAADRLNWGSFDRNAVSTLMLEADVDARRPSVAANATVSIAEGAKSTLRLVASHDAPTTRYEFEVRGAEAGPLLGAALFRDGGRASDELSFAFESRGELRGIISKDDSGRLALAERPLRGMRGKHRSALHVERLALRRAGVTRAIEGLKVEARSTHAAPGKGGLQATVSLEDARYGEPQQWVTLRDYVQKLQIAYAALHGAPSLSIETEATIGELGQPFVHQYPIRDVSLGARVDVDDTQVVAVRRAFLHNPAGGTRFEARGAYEGWLDAIKGREVCSTGIVGCPEVASMYGREAATVTGILEQDFSPWQSTARAKSGGSLSLPFTIESGDLATYRVKTVAEFRDLVLELPQYNFLIDDLDARIPIEQEFATAPRFFVVPARKGNAMAQKRFFDLHPFTKRDSYFTVNRIGIAREFIGPVAANLRIVGSALAMDQLHAGYRGGFVTGQFLADLDANDPKVVFRGNITGVKPAESDDVLDANLAVTFVPTTLIVEGKAQVVRVSKAHLYEIIDALDPYREDEDMNRVRLGLRFGYPKFVRLKLDEGLMNAKIDLGGLAGALRIDEIKGIPVTPFLEQYVQPYIERILAPPAMPNAVVASKAHPPTGAAAHSSLGGAAVSEMEGR